MITCCPTRSKRSWVYAAAPCLAVLICILLANPFSETGFADDWSYSRVAMKLSQTGKLQYNGWGSPLLLFQAFWALPWIRLFGFSFQTLQLATIPVSLAFVVLVYLVGRRAGLSPVASSFAATTTGTSALFVPFAASFMTESYGCFFSMLCIYAAVRSAQAEESGEARRWLWILAATGIVGGANRQIVWAAPMVSIPYLTWLRRTERRFIFHAGAACALSAIAVVIIVRLFGQPYAPLQLTRSETAEILSQGPASALRIFVSFLLVCVLVSMPAFACFFSQIRGFRPRNIIAGLVILASATLLVNGRLGIAAPYGNNIMTSVGIVTDGQEFIGRKPGAMHPLIRFALTALVNLCLAISIAFFLPMRRKSVVRDQAITLSIFGLFSISYLAMMLPGAMTQIAFDRYMLPLVPLLLIWVLIQFGRCHRRIPGSAWLCLLILACYSVAVTHDYFAALRTRVAAAHELERTAITPSRISAAAEYDGWSQLQLSEYARAVQYQDLFAENHRKGFWLNFWNHMADLRPDYVVLNWTSAEPAYGGCMIKQFHAWLPPFRRSVVVWKRDDLTAMLQAARIVAALR